MNQKQQINIILQYLFMDRKEIIKYFPVVPKVNPRKALDLLLLIHSKPKQTITGLKLLTHSHSNNLDSTLNQLLDLGYIIPCNRSRWVNAIHAWKVEIVYKPTKKGLFALTQLSNLIDCNEGIECEVKEVNNAA